MRLCPTWGGEGGTGGKVAGLRDHEYRLHTNRAHRTNAWLVFTTQEEGSHLDLGISWDKVGQEEPEERKGQGAWWTLFRGHDSPKPLPICLPPTTPHLSQRRGLLVPAAGPVLEGVERGGILCW